MTVAPADNNGAANGNASFTRTYNSGTAVTVTAPASAGTHTFSAWSGCTSAKTETCSVTHERERHHHRYLHLTHDHRHAELRRHRLAGAVQRSASHRRDRRCHLVHRCALRQFAEPRHHQHIRPLQHALSRTLHASRSPRPAHPTQPSSATRPSHSPSQPASSGPSLTVDAGTVTHAINPYIYGMNAYTLNTDSGQGCSAQHRSLGRRRHLPLQLPARRHQLRQRLVFRKPDTASPEALRATARSTRRSPLMLRSAREPSAPSPLTDGSPKTARPAAFPVATYPNQVAGRFDGRGCGNGVYPNGVNSCTNSSGCDITGNKATDTSNAVDATWTGAWVTFLVSKFGTAANGGVAVYDLDNEPTLVGCGAPRRTPAAIHLRRSHQQRHRSRSSNQGRRP